MRSLLLTALLAALPAVAQPVPAPISRVDVIENLGERIPLGLTFRSSDGKPFVLDQAFHQAKPVVLTLVYYQCPMLCNLVLSGLTAALSKTHLKLGQDYNVVTVSIDPKETPAQALERKRGHLQVLGRTESEPNWSFLTGDDAAIRALAKSVGFEYTYDAQSKQFAHAAVIFLLSPDGKITRYFYGMEFSPRDLELSLVEASLGRVGTTLDRLILTCFQYDPARRRYGPYVLAFVRIGALTVFAALATLLTILWRLELKAKKRREATA